MLLNEKLLDRNSNRYYLMVVFSLYYLLLTISSAINTAENATLNQLVIYLGTLLLVFLFINEFHGPNARLSSESIRLLLFLLFVYQSRLYSDDLNLFDKAFRKVVLNIILYVVVDYFVFRTGEIKVFFTSALVGIVFLCIIILNAPPSEDASTDNGFFIQTDQINVNGLGNYAVQGVLTFLFLWYKFKNNIIKYLLLGVMAVFIITIIGSASKAGLIGLFTAVVSWILYCLTAATKKKANLIFLILLITTGMYFLNDYILSETYLGKRLELVGELDEYYKNDSRGKLIQQGLDVFIQNPIMGVGLMQVAAKNSKNAYTHNEYVEILSNFGIVGALIYFPFIFIIWKRINRIKKYFYQDKERLYNLNFMKVVIIVLLIRGISVPLLTSIDEMILFAVAGGYTSYCESIARRKST